MYYFVFVKMNIKEYNIIFYCEGMLNLFKVFIVFEELGLEYNVRFEE